MINNVVVLFFLVCLWPVFLQLNKRFILSFLHAHGKLFTKVGWVLSHVHQLLSLCTNVFQWRAVKHLCVCFGVCKFYFFIFIFYLPRMESFPAVASRVLQEFRTLLQHGPSLLGCTNMLQIITINMFAIHNAHGRGKTALTERHLIISIFKC